MPTERLKDRVADLGEALDRLEAAFKAVYTVTGNDGDPLVEVDDVDAQFCTTSRQVLAKIGDELNFWGRTWRRRMARRSFPPSWMATKATTKMKSSKTTMTTPWTTSPKTRK